MHRLFLGLTLPPPLEEASMALMRDGPAGWAWQSAEQLHVTMRYIGELDTRAAEDIAAALEGFRDAALSLSLSGVGWFDHGARGALFARVEPKETLTALHQRLDRLLQTAGQPPEGRAYLPHVTLARKRSGARHPEDWLARHAATRTEPVQVRRLTLFESHLGREGSRYEALADYPLNA